MCQTVWCDSRDGLDTRDVDSVKGGFTEKLPGTADIYQELVSSDDEDFSEPDDGSVEDLEMNTWADWCFLFWMSSYMYLCLISTHELLLYDAIIFEQIF